MKSTNNISLEHFKYFILQNNHRNAVGILSENAEKVTYCNLTLLPYLHELTGQIKFRLDICPESAIRICPNPDFRNNIQIGLVRSLIDITKDIQEVERVLRLNKRVKEVKTLTRFDSQPQ
ncbi:hypothetical protein AAE02nite_37770 [Adhaeribacter aerolatus]|uniref:Uncharacterized protein n=1 Tax=Adhaeribacter aerolatus TaxID=670289 RepID=A0A512B2C6_9BACT|nr:hypothetical protein [Adhaeribacter aerolatus]GEO06113.1 hypothetical protein AAE02nite_37770 [Adhaeribacter aerolatus]